MYAANGRTRVTLVAHSMGGPVSLYFLNNIVSQSWKDTYIYAYVPIAAAWDGGVVALEYVISGLRVDIEFINRFIKPSFWGSLKGALKAAHLPLITEESFLMMTCLLPFIKLSPYHKSVQPQKHPLRSRRKVGAGGDNMQMNLIAMQGFSTAAMYVRMHTLFL